MPPTELALAGHKLRLLPSGAVLHIDSHTLLVADLHIGKDSSFRALGMPVPAQSSAATLAELSADLRTTQARHVVFLGDFLHAARGKTAQILALLHAWRSEHASVGMRLVRGNHDLASGDPPQSLSIECCTEPWTLPFAAAANSVDSLPLALCHHPQPVPGHYSLAGHLHPCVRLQGRGKQSLRLACFWFGSPDTRPQAVLPAYGDFTGMHPIALRPDDQVFVIAQDRVKPAAMGAKI